jgi:hypothetical protein
MIIGSNLDAGDTHRALHVAAICGFDKYDCGVMVNIARAALKVAVACLLRVVSPDLTFLLPDLSVRAYQGFGGPAFGAIFRQIDFPIPDSMSCRRIGLAFSAYARVIRQRHINASRFFCPVSQYRQFQPADKGNHILGKAYAIYDTTTSFNWWFFAYFISGAGAGSVSADGHLASADLPPPNIFLMGHSPLHPQPAKNRPITASINAVKIDFFRFIFIAPFVQ